MTEIYVHELESLEDLLEHGSDLRGCVLQGVDLRSQRGQRIDWGSLEVEGTVFLGCQFGDLSLALELQRRGALVFPRFEGLPYDPYRNRLYTWQELSKGASAEGDVSLDLQIYRHFEAQGRHLPDIREALAQRIHDHAIENAKRSYLRVDGHELPSRKAVGIMGGHGAKRSDEDFRRAARTARLLERKGLFVLTGGGPGIMEAGNLGAWLADLSDQELMAEIAALGPEGDSRADDYRAPRYRELALELLERHPRGRESLAVPTWFYGHEPSNLFATAIAKYFSNSLREDGLLADCLYGVVFAPGSAGTTQEVFMDAAQNHYGTFGWRSPMVFLGRERYSKTSGIFPLLEQLAAEGGYSEWLFLTDSPEDAIAFIVDHPPQRI